MKYEVLNRDQAAQLVKETFDQVGQYHVVDWFNDEPIYWALGKNPFQSLTIGYHEFVKVSDDAGNYLGVMGARDNNYAFYSVKKVGEQEVKKMHNELAVSAKTGHSADELKNMDDVEQFFHML